MEESVGHLTLLMQTINLSSDKVSMTNMRGVKRNNGKYLPFSPFFGKSQKKM